MKNFLSILFFTLISLSIYAQEVMTIAATIVDKETGTPVAFANIGFVEQNIGTVSNENGNFSLSWQPEAIRGASALQISSIGYETKEILLDDLEKLTSYKEIIYVNPTTYALDAVTISAEKRGYDRLGSYAYSKDKIGYWMNLQGLGCEIATRVKVDKKNTLLHDLTFNVLENKGDSLLVRVKVYDYHKGYPGKNLVPENIYYTITKKEGKETIPLKKYNIVVQEDIIVSLELVKVYGEYIYIALSSSPYKGIAFTKERSLAEWKSYRGTGIAFGLIASYPAETAAKEIASRSKPKRIDLYWDMSLNAKKRNIGEELKLLSKYMNDLGNVEVRVIKFNKGNTTEKMFSVTNGRSKALETYLEDTYYIGATDFSEVLKSNPTNAMSALVFTHGETAFEALTPEINIPIFCVNSKNKAAHAKLQDVSYVSGGHYINLAKEQVKNGLRYLTNEVEDEYTYDGIENVDTSGYVHGVVYNENNVPLQNATVRIKNTFTEVETKANGSYTINAAPGDVLSISAFGMYKKDTLVGALKKLHVPLKTNRELLDEVILEAKTSSQAIGDSIVETPFGRKKKAAVGFSIYHTITSDQIKGNITEISQLVNMSRGVEAVQQEILGTFKYRFRKFKHASFLLSTYAAVVIDEVVYDQNLPNVTLPLIDPANIERITLINTASAVVRYGSAAAFGAIVIETKANAKSKEFNRNSTRKEVSMLEVNNDYTEDTQITLLEREAVATAYSAQLKQSSTYAEARAQYSKLQKNYGDQIPFYLDTARYFEAWDAGFAESIRSNIIALAPQNSKALKALAYEYEAIGKIEDAKEVYEHILTLEPKEAQAYLDVARVSAETGDIETAEALYTQLLYNSIPNVNAEGVQDQIISGVKHLVAHHKSQLNFKELPAEFLEVGYKEDIRIVFDWNSSATDFELQFVNPQNKYYIFSHTAFKNKALLQQEIEHGFSSKEFIIDSSNPGRWLINIDTLSEPEVENPTYLKYTLYRNYGLPSETKEIKVVDLSKYTKKITLDTFLL